MHAKCSLLLANSQEAPEGTDPLPASPEVPICPSLELSTEEGLALLG